jgi:phosphatidylserine decarboxylase
MLSKANVQPTIYRGDVQVRRGLVFYFLKLYWFIWRWVVPQKFVSRIFGVFLETGISRHCIRPVCRLLGGVEMERFKPACGGQRYESFQDFYTRRCVTEAECGGDSITWPCDGLLAAVVDTKGEPSPPILVKGHLLKASEIFGAEIDASTPWLINVYLGVLDYHRVHSPVNGTVVQIKRFQGRLDTVNPVFYRQPFQPSFDNERVILTIRAKDGYLMQMAIVGAAYAGSIVINDEVFPGAELKSCQEVGCFRLGSQVCMTAPIPPQYSVGEVVIACSPVDAAYGR